MSYRLLADAVLLLHCAFVLFALFGGLLVLRYPRLLWPHLLALCWGVAVSWADWICPLTPLENHLRLLVGDTGYQAGFVEHFVMKLLYPENLTIELRWLAGIVLIAMNAAIYGWVFRRRRVRAEAE